MNYDEFAGRVQHRLELPGTGKTARAIRATPTTLGQRIQEGEAKDLPVTSRWRSANLPMEIGWYLTGPVREHGERFDWRELVARVSEIGGTESPAAAYRAQVIVDLVSTVAPPSEIRQVRDRLPEGEEDENWRELFEVMDAGGWGEVEEAQTGDGPQSGEE